MVMGALGLLAIQSLSFRRGRPFVAKYIVAGLSAGLMLFVLLGLGSDPATDVPAHLGGFGAGLLFGGLLATGPGRKLNSAKINASAGILLGALLFLTWALALL